MWRLSPTALIEGVKSTTRYRSKHPSKRGARNSYHAPQLTRQSSAARSNRRATRSHRPDDRYALRSIPAAYDQNDPSTSHPASYYNGPDGNQYQPTDIDFAYTHNRFGSPVPGHTLFSSPALSYANSPLSPGMPGIGDAGFVLDQSPSASLFSNSPADSPDGPCTPVDGLWADEGVYAGAGLAGVWDGVPFEEYEG